MSGVTTTPSCSSLGFPACTSPPTPLPTCSASIPTAATGRRRSRASIKVMQGWGYDPEEVPCGTVHRPWLVSADRALKTLDALDAVGGGSFKALYVAGLEETLIGGNPKVYGRGLPGADSDVISLFNDSWKMNAGRIMRETFTEPSRWETQSELAGTRRGPHRRHR